MPDGEAAALATGARAIDRAYRTVRNRVGSSCCPLLPEAGTAAVLLAEYGFVSGVESILMRSADGRKTFARAIAQGFSCSQPLSDVVQTLSTVADNRQSLLAEIPSTFTARDASIANALKRAFRESITSDRLYKTYFTSQKCPKLTRTPVLSMASRSDSLATAAKTQFSTAFDDAAKQFRQRSNWSQGDF